MLANETGRKISVKAIFALIFYLIIPVVAIIAIMNSYPELSKERFMNILYWIIPVAIVLVIISQLSIRYPRGDNRRFALNVLYIITAIFWIFGLVGGEFVVTQSWGEYEFSLHLEKYLILIFAVMAFDLFYYTLEWSVYRKDWQTQSPMVQGYSGSQQATSA